MDSKDSKDLWSRRVNNGKLNLSTSSSNASKDNTRTDSPRSSTQPKRYGNDSTSHGRSITSNGASNALQSPGLAGPSAFQMGHGAFANFGSSKVPKTPSAESTAPTLPEKVSQTGTDIASNSTSAQDQNPTSSSQSLRYTWVLWFRPPTAKSAEYEKSIIPMASFSNVDQFWAVYGHLKRPSVLPTVSEYHLFRKGIRPIWEDEENKRGGKYILRLKKGVADRYWENILLALIGDQFFEASEEVTGAVVSVRNGEDVLCVWTKYDGGKNIRIRENIKELLKLPKDTNLMFKSHGSSISQRAALDEARREKLTGNGPQLKRRDTFSEDLEKQRS